MPFQVHTRTYSFKEKYSKFCKQDGKVDYRSYNQDSVSKMAKWIIVHIIKYLYKPYVITGKLLTTHFYFYFLSLKYGVRRA